MNAKIDVNRRPGKMQRMAIAVVDGTKAFGRGVSYVSRHPIKTFKAVAPIAATIYALNTGDVYSQNRPRPARPVRPGAGATNVNAANANATKPDTSKSAILEVTPGFVWQQANLESGPLTNAGASLKIGPKWRIGNTDVATGIRSWFSRPQTASGNVTSYEGKTLWGVGPYADLYFYNGNVFLDSRNWIDYNAARPGDIYEKGYVSANTNTRLGGDLFYAGVDGRYEFHSKGSFIPKDIQRGDLTLLGGFNIPIIGEGLLGKNCNIRFAVFGYVQWAGTGQATSQALPFGQETGFTLKADRGIGVAPNFRLSNLVGAVEFKSDFVTPAADGGSRMPICLSVQIGDKAWNLEGFYVLRKADERWRPDLPNRVGQAKQINKQQLNPSDYGTMWVPSLDEAGVRFTARF